MTKSDPLELYFKKITFYYNDIFWFHTEYSILILQKYLIIHLQQPRSQ